MSGWDGVKITRNPVWELVSGEISLMGIIIASRFLEYSNQVLFIKIGQEVS
jgi:hypothetical protein